jgi:hypothetical protein
VHQTEAGNLRVTQQEQHTTSEKPVSPE